jgi:hypothetical protein
MNSNIRFLYTYKAGLNTKNGFFPVYSGEIQQCQRDLQVIDERLRDLTRETPRLKLYTPESDTFNLETILVELDDGDAEILL